ncbi:NAD-dependent epimerase/dehydratase family protein [Anaeromyxobacter terrae]|uniref:NAD-dependent epimerase/dehydratase family protein n=1 Tax=Anaeromyxobacter terrae TaxID=2925406 RepID=UPI001F5AA2F0|nr:NAD-dependent epimerase/dehydratase family protein [Anaeromyxobacter sp. SG22]
MTLPENAAQSSKPDRPVDPGPPELHVVFGAGQIGTRLATELLSRGLRVRMVRRGQPAHPLPGVEWRRADVADREAAAEAARGAAVVYDCANPAEYHRWDELLPPLKRGVREAAARAGARLVVLDCLYMYGSPDRTPFDEDTPMRPCSHKGELRAMLARELSEAHARGEVRATTGRASDYFGPDVPTALLGARFAERILAGKPIEMGGDPDQPHGYSYGPDVARGLAVLGANPSADGKVWHLPLSWTGTTRGLVEAIGAALGRRGRVRPMPDWLMRAAGLLSPVLGAAAEMTYQWKVPYVIDDRRFREAFGVEPTAPEVAVAETAEWIRSLAPARAA